MKNYYVYELVNLMGTVEYVGNTSLPEHRFRQHTKWKPGNHGKFFNRQDVFMNLVSSYATKKEAKVEEMRLQKYWGFQTEDEKVSFSTMGKSKNKGSKNSQSKLNEKQVKQIKRMLENKIQIIKIAEIFNVSVGPISAIKNKKAWKHITI